MASRPLQRAVVGALAARAQGRLGWRATPLDYVEAWLSSGGTFVSLAKAISDDLSRPVSRGFVSFVCQRLDPQARVRVRTAREVRSRAGVIL
jgi:hypothetical protein